MKYKYTYYLKNSIFLKQIGELVKEIGMNIEFLIALSIVLFFSDFFSLRILFYSISISFILTLMK